MEDESEIIPPRQRLDFLAAPDFEAGLTQLLRSGALANGWLITGGPGIGKATLAFRLARAILSSGRGAATSLDVKADDQVVSLVASGGHPDLFIADLRFDEKKERYATEISVEVIRELIHFMNHTASMGGWRVAIIDTADDLNRNSANALLKVLEEPPAKTALFVLSAAPGRLLPTIRSRCRSIAVRPLAESAIADFLVREGAADPTDAQRIAAVSGGRPGFALSLARGDGADAIGAVDEFWRLAWNGEDLTPLSQRLTGKSADGAWPLFQLMLLSRVAATAREKAMADDSSAASIVDLGERIAAIFGRGDALNLDRVQLILSAGRAFKKYSGAAVS